MNFDFKSMETYHYLMMGGGGLLFLAILVYSLTGKKGRVAAFAAAIIGSLAVGFGTGIVALGANGYHWDRKPDRFDPTLLVLPGHRVHRQRRTARRTAKRRRIKPWNNGASIPAIRCSPTFRRSTTVAGILCV